MTISDQQPIQLSSPPVQWVYANPIYSHVISYCLSHADFMQINQDIGSISYRHLPDDSSEAEDVVIEAHSDEQEYHLTVADIEQSQALPEGGFLIPRLGFVCFHSRCVRH